MRTFVGGSGQFPRGKPSVEKNTDCSDALPEVNVNELSLRHISQSAIPTSCWVQDEGGPTKTVTSDETYPLITVASRESTSRSR